MFKELVAFGAGHLLSTLCASFSVGWLLALLGQYLRQVSVSKAELFLASVVFAISIAGLLDLF